MASSHLKYQGMNSAKVRPDGREGLQLNLMRCDSPRMDLIRYRDYVLNSMCHVDREAFS